MLPAEILRHLTDLAANGGGEPFQTVGMIHGIGNPGNHICSEGSLLVPGAAGSELFSRFEIKKADGDTGRSEIDCCSQTFGSNCMHRAAAGGEVPGKIVLRIAQHDGAVLSCRRLASADGAAAVSSYHSNGTVAAFTLSAARRIDRKAFPLQNSEQAFSFRKGNGMIFVMMLNRNTGHCITILSLSN